MSEVNRDITLEFADKEFTFRMTPQDVTKYFNSMTNNNKVAPSRNLLMTTVDQVEKASLKPFLENPTTVMELASALLEEYSPDIDIIVKKPSSTLSD
ncbi:putative phage tail assembly chaperone [Pseudomonas sp. B26140]|uniref:putative phage tail assembly chaperone n=1 Tax=Pseudomonas sp. B26140 TaxID=3235112 RepID=UPI003784372F